MVGTVKSKTKKNTDAKTWSGGKRKKYNIGNFNNNRQRRKEQTTELSTTDTVFTPSPAVVTFNSFSAGITATSAAATSVFTSDSAVAETSATDPSLVQNYVVSALEKMSPQDNADILSRLGVAKLTPAGSVRIQQGILRKLLPNKQLRARTARALRRRKVKTLKKKGNHEKWKLVYNFMHDYMATNTFATPVKKCYNPNTRTQEVHLQHNKTGSLKNIYGSDFLPSSEHLNYMATHTGKTITFSKN
jgi:hypothetical protein